MEGESFYGVVLDEAGATQTWNSIDTGDNVEEEQPPLFKLVIKQILLNPHAKRDEYNVVEVRAKSMNTTVTIPIAVLKVGEIQNAVVNLEFPEAPVTFKLVEGSGPVYIHGNVISNYMEPVDEVEDECAELMEEEQEEEVKPEKKRKMGENGSKAGNSSSNIQKPSKKQKTG